MTRNLSFRAAMLAAGLLCLSTPAGATITTTTFQGFVSIGSDDTGVFGAPGTDLTGATYTAVFTTDDALATSTFTTPSYSEIDGAGATTATLTINGVTWSFSGASSSSLDKWTPAFCCGGGLEMVNSAGSGASHLDIDNGFSSGSGLFVSDGDYHTPFTYTLNPGDATEGGFSISDGFPFIQAYGLLTPTSVRVGPLPTTPPPGAPEPTTWAMMLAGFGSLGWTIRSSRRSRIVVAL